MRFVKFLFKWLLKVRAFVAESIGMDGNDRELRRLRLEAREQLEDAEEAAGELAAATRSLRDALLDEGRQGFVVQVEVGGTEIVGRVEHVGDELVRVCSPDGARTAIVLDAIQAVRVVRRDGHASLVSIGYPQTLSARLREWVQVGAAVEVGRRSGAPTRGRLRAVTPTHVELVDGEHVAWLIPLSATAWAKR